MKAFALGYESSASLGVHGEGSGLLEGDGARPKDVRYPTMKSSVGPFFVFPKTLSKGDRGPSARQ